jgi:ZIP family zinc transporter
MEFSNVIVLASLIVFLFTSFGALLSLIFNKVSENTIDFSLAFSSGIMLVASFTSLIIPSLELGNIFLTNFGIIMGFLFVYLLEKLVPHIEKLNIPLHVEENKFKAIFLIVGAIIIHNLPEGLAVGVSLGNDMIKGLITALAIGIQDIPEGLAVSLPLIYITEKKFIPILIGIISGLSEAIFVILGALFFSLYNLLLPIGLSLAGGAMLYVVIKEIFPQIYRNKNEKFITFFFLLGLLIMLSLDNIKI